MLKSIYQTERGYIMAALATTTRTQLTISYEGEGGASGGTFTLSSLDHGASDGSIEQTARAINSLQEPEIRAIFKNVTQELEEA
jgi:hypothetical protein